MTFIIIVAIIILMGYLYSRKLEREREEEHRRRIGQLREEAKRLAAAYPDVYYKRFHKVPWELTESELYQIDRVSEKSWDAEQKEFDSKDDEKYYLEWIKKQEKFNTTCIAHNKSTLKTWGRYYYDINGFGTYPNGKSFYHEVNVWVHFAHSFCTDSSIDYSLGFHQLDTSKLAKNYKTNPSSLSNSYWDTIINYLDAVYETNKDLFVILVENAPDDTESDESPERFTYLKSLLDSKYPYSNLKDFSRCDGFWSSDSIVLIDLISNNDKITEYCQKAVRAKRVVFTKFPTLSFRSLSDNSDLSVLGFPKTKPIVHHNHTDSDTRLKGTPSVTYLTIFKEHSSKEMKDLVSAKRKEIEAEIKAAEEQRRKELEECRKAQEQLRKEQERIRKENEEKERKRTAPTRLQNAVSSWYRPSAANLRCYSMYYYYPTTCDFEASQYDWDIRNMIWDFKANPHKPMSIETIMRLHKDAVSEIVDDMEKCLNHFFGEDTKYLTLVCVPSSQAVINQRRYEDFAQLMCSRTQMENGYSHIRVTADGEAKHMGGTNVAKYEIDAEFFKGKNIILFDDVITSGRSMEQLRAKLQNVGANVIGGFSIGKTKHEKQNGHPIKEIHREHTEDYIDNLPF